MDNSTGARARQEHTDGGVWFGAPSGTSPNLVKIRILGVELLTNFLHFMNHKMMHMVAMILVWVGAINWGLIGLGGFMGANWNVVGMILGSWPMLEWLVYVLVGLSGVYEIFMHKGNCKACAGGQM